jgi:ribonucleoside-diphosphate reductase alpha chain
LSRNDLAHVQPADLTPDTLGKGISESSLPEGAPKPDVAAVVRSFASTGYVRSKLTVFQGGAAKMVTAPATTATTGLAGNAAIEIGIATAVETTVGVVAAVDARLEQIRTARLKGYEGDSCTECGNFTLVRNGTCLKCDTCGQTSGCS